MGMHNSVICTEDFDFYPDQSSAQRLPTESFMGDVLLEYTRALCEVWPKGEIDKNFKDPVLSNKPVLLVSGERDPITPPVYADNVLKNLTNARHVVLAGQAHNVSPIGCAPTLIAKFIDELEPANIDASCLDRIRAAPFFVDFNGPKL